MSVAFHLANIESCVCEIRRVLEDFSTPQRSTSDYQSYSGELQHESAPESLAMLIGEFANLRHSLNREEDRTRHNLAAVLVECIETTYLILRERLASVHDPAFPPSCHTETMLDVLEKLCDKIGRAHV